MGDRSAFIGATGVDAPSVRLTESPIDPAKLLAQVSGTAHGAAILFLGTVRETNEGRAVEGIEYSAYPEMAGKLLREITMEAQRKFGTGAIAIEHRLGALGLGDVSVAIAVAHPHRAPAFDAARYIIEELKKRVHIWKREHYSDGTREWVDPTAGGKGQEGKA
jgi:molybdopterin synthase catalytic subunit